MQYIVIDLIIQIGLRFSLAHHRTDFGLVYGWSEIFPFWESRGSNFSQSALDNFLEKTISGRTQSMNKLFVNRLARLENVQATPEICNRHHRRCRSKNSAMWRNFRLNAEIVPFKRGENLSHGEISPHEKCGDKSGKFLHMRKVEKICHMEKFLRMRDVQKIYQVEKFST